MVPRGSLDYRKNCGLRLLSYYQRNRLEIWYSIRFDIKLFLYQMLYNGALAFSTYKR